MNALYNLAIALYDAGVHLAARHSGKARRLVEGHRTLPDRLRAIASRPRGRKRVWIHAASLGEFEQGRPLIERIKREQPDTEIVLTFFSPSGYEVRKNYPVADYVEYLPFDRPKRVRQFLDAVDPTMAIFVKYEFWGNYLEELNRRKIPTYIISAIFRPGQAFFRPWGGAMRRMLGRFTRLFVQDETSAALLESVGLGERTTVAGDTRFDRVLDIMRTVVEMPVLDSFADNARHLLVAGSSWPADEDIIIPWLQRHPDVKSVFAPHEFDADRLMALRKRLGRDCCLLSELTADPLLKPEETRHIIVDSFGLLASVYRKGTMAYVGGGFGAGIHNLNEAAVYDLPVIFGPNNRKFKEAADLRQCGGGYEVTDADTFGAIADTLIGDESRRAAAGHAAGNYIRRSVGATDIIYHHLFPQL